MTVFANCLTVHYFNHSWIFDWVARNGVLWEFCPKTCLYLPIVLMNVDANWDYICVIYVTSTSLSLTGAVFSSRESLQCNRLPFE